MVGSLARRPKALPAWAAHAYCDQPNCCQPMYLHHDDHDDEEDNNHDHHDDYDGGNNHDDDHDDDDMDTVHKA